ncbi:MAG: glycosyl transferase family 2 [Cyanobacteria bacterium RYN_339]|nr:glycosyl transferase family 2 [Cyanobacteria bacterium RYN_339]
MSGSLPFISVVVPAYNRPHGLAALLDALAEQSYPPYRFEVLVCDDGSKPALAELVPIKDLPFSLNFLRDENQGPAAARNRGIKAARGSIVAFTDDDCLPLPHWLEAIAETLQHPEPYAVHGPTYSTVPPIDPFVHSLHIEQIHGVATANFAARKDKLLAVDGFDENFRAPYFEDEDLSRRLQERFGPITWAAEARVEHPPRVVPLRKAFKSAGYTYYLPYMRRKYPGYRAGFMAGVARRIAAKTVLVAIGLAPLAGAPVALGVAWLALFAWQAKRLQRTLAEVASAKLQVPVVSQLAFLGTEWLLDYARGLAYVRGLALRPRPVSLGLEELLR